MKRSTSVRIQIVGKRMRGSLNIKLTLSATWRNTLGKVLNVKYVGLCGRRRKTDMNMKGAYTDHSENVKIRNVIILQKTPRCSLNTK